MRINGEGAPALTIGMLTGRSRERQRPSFNCSSRRTTARYVYSRRQRPHTITGRVAVVLLAVAILIATLVLAKRLGSSSFCSPGGSSCHGCGPTRLPERADVLQLGCGAGGETEGWARRFPFWPITATDYDPDMVARAGRRLAFLGEWVRIRPADATDLPYPDGMFDLAVAVHVWRHVGDWPAATAEVHRVLRPGGVLLLADFVVPTGIARRFPRSVPPGTYTLPEVRAALPANGFTPDLRTGWGGLWYRVVARR